VAEAQHAGPEDILRLATARLHRLPGSRRQHHDHEWEAHGGAV